MEVAMDLASRNRRFMSMVLRFDLTVMVWVFYLVQLMSLKILFVGIVRLRSLFLIWNWMKLFLGIFGLDV